MSRKARNEIHADKRHKVSLLLFTQTSTSLVTSVLTTNCAAHVKIQMKMQAKFTHNLVPRVSLLCLHCRSQRQKRETLGTRLVHTSNANPREIRHAGAVQVLFPRWWTRMNLYVFFLLRVCVSSCEMQTQENEKFSISCACACVCVCACLVLR